MEPLIYVVQQLPPEFAKRPENFTPKEAKAYYEWYMDILPQRVAYLTQTCAAEMKVSIESFDDFPNCCKVLWEWFLRHATLQETSEEERAQMRAQFGYLGEWWIAKEKVSDFSELVLRDIGMFLGDSWVRHYPSLHWELVKKPKNYINVNKPHVVGFSSKDIFEPIHMASVQASKILDNRQYSESLFDMIVHWKALV